MNKRLSPKSTTSKEKPGESGVILVSACLAGVRCRFDGKSKTIMPIKQLVHDGKAIPVCPEKLGGLKTPRPPAEIRGGDGNDVLAGQAKVFDKTGQDITERFLKGARETLQMARKLGARKAILKSGSPSCGLGLIYNGSFHDKLIQGNGVTAALLVQNKIAVTTEEKIMTYEKSGRITLGRP